MWFKISITLQRFRGIQSCDNFVILNSYIRIFLHQFPDEPLGGTGESECPLPSVRNIRPGGKG